MEDTGTNSIIQRLCILSTAINGCGIEKENDKFSRYLLAKEGLLDALLVLYDECNNDAFKRNSYISKFIKKCKYRARYISLLYI